MFNITILLLPVIYLNYFCLFPKTYVSLSFFLLNIIFLFFLWNISKHILSFSKNYMSYWSVYFNTMIILFIISMVFLLMSNSWLLLFMGWEMLGVTSFLLILYYNNWNSISGSLLTIMSNRLGDMFFMLSLIFFSLFKPLMMLIIIMMMSMTKSAQFPFSSWLPAAMAAPTPVSALVHSSTLVTAGIYVFFRFNLMLNYNFNKTMVTIFLMTVCVGSFSAISESDLKKLIAFSTLSQLGLIFMGFYSLMSGLVFFHLLTHAIFKSILFVTAGFIIWVMSSQSTQSSFILSLCLNSLVVLSVFNMMGFVYTSGFMSKDYLLFSMMVSSLAFCLLLLLTMFLTFLYSLRLILGVISSLVSTKNSFNLNITKIKVFYLLFMLFTGRMWTYNMAVSLNLLLVMKLILLFLFILLIFSLSTLSVFKNLISLNYISSKMLFLELEKDSLNFLTNTMNSFQAKMVSISTMTTMFLWSMIMS